MHVRRRGAARAGGGAAARLPLWLKLAFTAWMVVWVPAYWRGFGPSNFLWFCDVANFVILLALWRESPLLMSAQTVGVLLMQLAWAVDFLGGLLLGVFPLGGGTAYMFDAEVALGLRCLSLFHLVMPALLLWTTWRLGFDRRGILVQTGIAWLVLPISFMVGTREQNLNWVWEPFGLEQVWLPPLAYLGLEMVLCPLLLYLPVHLLLARLAPRVPPTLLDSSP